MYQKSRKLYSALEWSDVRVWAVRSQCFFLACANKEGVLSSMFKWVCCLYVVSRPTAQNIVNTESHWHKVLSSSLQTVLTQRRNGCNGPSILVPNLLMQQISAARSAPLDTSWTDVHHWHAEYGQAGFHRAGTSRSQIRPPPLPCLLSSISQPPFAQRFGSRDEFCPNGVNCCWGRACQLNERILQSACTFPLPSPRERAWVRAKRGEIEADRAAAVKIDL